MKKFFLTTTLSVCSVSLLLGLASYSWADSSTKCPDQACRTKACVTCPQSKDSQCGQAKKKCGPRRHSKRNCRASVLTDEQRAKLAEIEKQCPQRQDRPCRECRR